MTTAASTATKRRKKQMPDDSYVDHVYPQHQRRFEQIDRDISNVRTDVGVLQADVKTLAAGQSALQESQDRGFRDLKDTLTAKSQEPPQIGIGTLFSVIGVLITLVAVGIGTLWSAVLLLADPIKTELKDYKESTKSHGRDIALMSERAQQTDARLSLAVKSAEEHSAARHVEQQNMLESAIEGLKATRNQHEKTIELQARMDERLKTLENTKRE